MGYTTYFDGKITTKQTISDEIRNYLERFMVIRHMKRDNQKIREVYPDWKEHCLNGKLGIDGEFFATPELLPEEYAVKSFFGGMKNWKGEDAPEGYLFNPVGQDSDVSVTDKNTPGGSCPGLWCQWRLDGSDIVWDGGEKFYNYVEWLDWLIRFVFDPANIKFNGRIYWQGEEINDYGIIDVEDNKIDITYQYAGIREEDEEYIEIEEEE